MTRLNLLAVVSALGLSACGGGAGGETSFIPPSPPPPPPPASAQVVIFPSPTPGEYASVGVWTNVGEWVDEYPTTPDGSARITDISTADSSQPRVRYTSTGHYEVQLPGEAFDRLIHHGNVGQPTSDNTLFELQSTPARTIRIFGSRNEGYSYSEMMSWWRPDLDFASTADFGAVAFGLPTPTGSVPVSGSASYQGHVTGITDAKGIIGTSSDYFLMPVEGTVRLDFDFGSGRLGGEMHLILNEGMNTRDLGIYTFDQTVFAAGSATYSGNFATPLSGFNFFNGRFTGPSAEETIGSWAVPFGYDGATHQAIGAWIARRGN